MHKGQVLTLLRIRIPPKRPPQHQDRPAKPCPERRIFRENVFALEGDDYPDCGEGEGDGARYELWKGGCRVWSDFVYVHAEDVLQDGSVGSAGDGGEEDDVLRRKRLVGRSW